MMRRLTRGSSLPKRPSYWTGYAARDRCTTLHSRGPATIRPDARGHAPELPLARRRVSARGLAQLGDTLERVIPIAFIVGVVVGRWWFLPVAAIGWAIALVATGVTDSWAGMAAVGGCLAALNAGIGITLHKGVVAVFRLARTIASN